MSDSRSWFAAVLSERRQTLTRVCVALACAVGGVAVLAPAASAATTVSCGATIGTPGTYVLAGDCSGAGISISASDVTLKLDGHTMTGLVQSTGILVDDSASAVSGDAIMGPGTITGYSFGVVLGAGGIGVSGATVSGLTTNDGAFGIVVEFNANGSTVNNNTADNMMGSGIGILGSGNTVNNNTADNNAGGIDILGSGNTVNNNAANDNTTIGITAFGGADTINHNTALGNGAFDLADFNPGCGTDTWRANTFTHANESCIR